MKKKKIILSLLFLMIVCALGYSIMEKLDYSGNNNIHFLDRSLASGSIEQVLKNPEFKNKVVFVDIWESWCGACIKQFPYSTSLKNRFKSEPVEYLYISYNNKFRIDHQAKWKELIKENNLEGYHLEVSKDFYEDLWNRIKINSAEKTMIPRYLIIGKDGRIINKDAANPQSGELLYSQLKKALTE